MDQTCQLELDHLSMQIGEHDLLQRDLSLQEGQLSDTLIERERTAEEFQFECDWLSKRESSRFESIMLKEVSCHLLSNRPFVCSLQSGSFINADVVPG